MLLENVSDSMIEENFWSSDNTALQILLDKLEETTRSIKSIQHYFARRVQIEEEYGNELMKLSQLYMEESFQALSTSTEMSARAHIDLSQDIKSMLEIPLEKYLNDRESIKSAMIHQLKVSHDIKSLYNNNNVIKQRDIQKNENQESNDWVNNWRKSCRTFQLLESKRLEHLRSIIKTFSSMISCLYNIDDQTCERLFLSMEDLNINLEISKFIKNHKTGALILENQKSEKNLEFFNCKTFKEINIPVNSGEELRSVNEQLEKISNLSVYNSNSNIPIIYKYPINPVYTKSSQQSTLQNGHFLNLRLNKENKSTTLSRNTQLHYGKSNCSPTRRTILLASMVQKKSLIQKGDQQMAKQLHINGKIQPLSVTSSQKDYSSPPSPLFSPSDFYYYSPTNIEHISTKS
ncbi:uncharacterized protein BX663DRAFT_526977 [Cokeromyces recurvatus]|uniref:uncharacterized protein n=1 Tax=Cokeromyces recurvatus TaxID=90255 RepID=UPI0022202E83|nr:uncharacterized protein BX663DRAFT_526977 [Cokeromyces recurvatus]KAI7897816.1 hypothetical protein BX663DRAFT_526977 [Cokeromyces recurvatus]